MRAADEITLYWLVWLFCVLLSNIIFLNFIIAELSNIYSVVSEALIPMQNLGKA